MRKRNWGSDGPEGEERSTGFDRDGLVIGSRLNPVDGTGKPEVCYRDYQAE
jgi:hypothetical protein